MPVDPMFDAPLAAGALIWAFAPEWVFVIVPWGCYVADWAMAVPDAKAMAAVAKAMFRI